MDGGDVPRKAKLLEFRGSPEGSEIGDPHMGKPLLQSAADHLGNGPSALEKGISATAIEGDEFHRDDYSIILVRGERTREVR